MHWVLQSNIFNEKAWDEFMSTLQRFELPYSEHKVIPFIGELSPDPVELKDKNVICFGSYSMRHVARKYNWKPGVFDLNDFDFNFQREIWPKDMLNGDSTVTQFQHVDWSDGEPRFIRPVSDSKVFAGKMFEHDDFKKWQHDVCTLNLDFGTSLESDTLVQVAIPKQIFAEYRCWVVKGKVITISRYKLGEKVMYTNWDMMSDEILPYAQACIDRYAPLDAFVIDVCQTPDGMRIVELNTLNSCGFYAADLQKLVHALTEAFDVEKK